MTLKALIFDVDGTLAETERDGHRPAFNQAFADNNLDWDWDVKTYGDLLKITGGKERMKYYQQTYNPKQKVSDEQIAHLHKIKTQYYVQAVAEGALPLRPGVVRLLKQARQQGLLLAVATTTSMDNVLALLRHQMGEDSPDWFACIGAGDVVKDKKPAPDIYSYVLTKLNLKPEECIAFEDSRNGLLSAMGANLTTVITPSFYTNHESFDEAALVVSHLGEPGQPNRCLSGPCNGYDMVNVELLKSIS